MNMMVFGIGGMAAHVLICQFNGWADACHWMELVAWAVIAVCGAIKEAKR